MSFLQVSYTGPQVEVAQDGAVSVVQVSTPGPAGPPGTDGAGYRLTFSEASLTVAGLLIVSHNLGAYPTSVTVWGSTGEVRWPDDVAYLTSNILAVDFSNHRPLSGNWTVAVGG